MPSIWAVRLLVAVSAAVVVLVAARTYMRNRRIDYWTLAEDANRPSDQDAHMRILFVGNSFIHYNGGAEKVQCSQQGISRLCTLPLSVLSGYNQQSYLVGAMCCRW